MLEVPVEANKPLKAGDVLFRIDPVPYEAQARALEANLKFEELRLAQMKQLQATGSGRAFDVEQRQAEVDQLKAQYDGAKWNLEKTVVRAPADGYVTNVALRKGARATTAPVMAFIDTSETMIGVEIAQVYSRYVQPGQSVELTFKFVPGTIYTGKVETVLQAVAAGQVQTSGTAVAADGHPIGAIRRPGQAGRHGLRQPAACGCDRHGGDLHRSRQGGTRHPRRHAAAGRDPESDHFRNAPRTGRKFKSSVSTLCARCVALHCKNSEPFRRFGARAA